MKDRKIWLTIMMLAVMATVGVASGQTYQARVNFQKNTYDVSELPVTGYVADIGETYADRGSNGGNMSYGWSQNRTGDAKNRNMHADERYDTMIKLGSSIWEIAVPAGTYDLFIVCGDIDSGNATNNLDVEGVIVSDPTPGGSGAASYDEYTLTDVYINDGRLSITGSAGFDNLKICFTDIVLVALDLTFNPAPVSNAGPDQLGYTIDTFQLDGSASSDEGSLDGTTVPQGFVSIAWSQLSGPGTATFDPIGGDVLSPTVTFNAKGVYRLGLRVSDIEPKDANDVVVITVKDHADEWIVGHWPLDDDADDDSVNSNHGTLKGAEGVPDGMPTYSTDAAVGTHCIDLSDTLGLEAIDDHDPNVKHIDLGAATELDFATDSFTVSVWVKTTTPGSTSNNADRGTIFGNGGDNSGGKRYTLMHNCSASNRVNFEIDDNVNRRRKITDADYPINDGLWHHIVGVKDGDQQSIYRDGILDNTGTIDSGYDLSGTVQWNSYIGVITDNQTGTVYRHLDGQVDDVRIYNYALPVDAVGYDSILSLTATGRLAPDVDAGPDLLKYLYPGELVPMAGSYADIGLPGTLNPVWSTVSGPEDANAVFTDDTSPVSTVSFPVSGVYVLRLTVEDVDLGIFIADDVTVEAFLPICADVATEGLLNIADVSGPTYGEPDCYVNLYDIAYFAEWFLGCYDPQGAECEDLFGLF